MPHCIVYVIQEYGYNTNDLVLSSIISIQKVRSSLSSSDNYRGISLFNGICKLFDYVIMLLCIHVMIICIPLTCNLGLNHNNVQPCLSRNH